MSIGVLARCRHCLECWRHAGLLDPRSREKHLSHTCCYPQYVFTHPLIWKNPAWPRSLSPPLLWIPRAPGGSIRFVRVEAANHRSVVGSLAEVAHDGFLTGKDRSQHCAIRHCPIDALTLFQIEGGLRSEVPMITVEASPRKRLANS